MQKVMDFSKMFYNKVVVDEGGDLVQNIMWLAFIALACVVAVGKLGGTLASGAENASAKIKDAIGN